VLKGSPVVAYLRGDYQSLEPILECLSQRHATLAYLPNIAPALAARIANERLTLSQVPFDLAAHAGTCDALICHAGAGTMPAFIEAGVPVLMLPYQAEQRSNAECIARLGAGLLLEPRNVRASFASSLEQLLGDPRYARAARERAVRWRGRVDGIATAAQRIGEFVDSSNSGAHDSGD
jgi:UDP-N-acetylglucosamine:LPS N-acetylglucosamine transferase